MIPLVTDNLDELRSRCARYRVRSLHVIGSALEERRFDPAKSDLDFLVDFLPLGPGEHADAYFGLLESLEELFQRHVDLVMISAIRNRYFLEAVSEHREQVYAA